MQYDKWTFWKYEILHRIKYFNKKHSPKNPLGQLNTINTFKFYKNNKYKFVKGKFININKGRVK